MIEKAYNLKERISPLFFRGIREEKGESIESLFPTEFENGPTGTGLPAGEESIAGLKSEAIELVFDPGTITLRELITSRVEEMRRHNAQDTKVFRGLAHLSDSEQI